MPSVEWGGGRVSEEREKPSYPLSPDSGRKEGFLLPRDGEGRERRGSLSCFASNEGEPSTQSFPLLLCREERKTLETEGGGGKEGRTGKEGSLLFIAEGEKKKVATIYHYSLAKGGIVEGGGEGGFIPYAREKKQGEKRKSALRKGGGKNGKR